MARSELISALHCFSDAHLSFSKSPTLKKVFRFPLKHFNRSGVSSSGRYKVVIIYPNPCICLLTYTCESVKYWRFGRFLDFFCKRSLFTQKGIGKTRRIPTKEISIWVLQRTLSLNNCPPLSYESSWWLLPFTVLTAENKITVSKTTQIRGFSVVTWWIFLCNKKMIKGEL